MSFQVGNLDLGVAFKADLSDLQSKLGQAGGAVEGFGKKAGGAMREVAKEADRTDESMQRLAQGIKGALLGGSVAVGLITLKNQITGVAGALIEAQVQLDRLRNGFNFGAGGLAAGVKELAFVRQEAERLGLEINGTATQYMKLVAASRGSAMAGAQTRDVFKAIAEASTVMGLGVEQSERAFMAVGQMMSKGKVQAEELRGQLGEHLPGAFGIAARAMGMTEAELNKFMETGNLMAEDFLPKFAAQLRQELADSVEDASKSMQASLNRMSSAWTNFKQQLVQSGIGQAIQNDLNAFAGQINVLGDTIEASRLRGHGMWRTLGNAGAATAAIAAIESFEWAVNTTNKALYLASGGLLDFNRNVQYTPDALRPTAIALDNTLTKLRDAGVEYDRLSERVKREPENIYLKSELSNLARYIARLREARNEYQLLLTLPTVGAGRGTINPPTVGEIAEREDRRLREQQAALKEFSAKFANPQEKAAEEIEKWKKSLGELYSPAIEAKIREHYIKPTRAAGDATAAAAKAAIEAAAKQYQDLVLKAQGRIALAQQELDLGRQLTDAEKEQVKTLEMLASVKDKLDPVQLKAVEMAYKEAAAIEQRVAAQRAEIKAAEDLARARQEMRNADYEASAAAIKEAEAASVAVIKSVTDRRQAMEDELTAQRLALAGNISLAEAIEQVTTARLQEKRPLLLEGSPAYEAVEREIEARKKLMGVIADKAKFDEARAMWESVDRTAQSVFVNVFESGSSAFKRLGQTLKAAVLDLLYQMTLKKWIISVGASVSGSAAVAGGSGGGVAGLGGQGMDLLGMGSTIAKVYSTIKGGFAALGDSVAFAAQDMGAWLMQNTTGVLNQAGGSLMTASSSLGTFASGAAGALGGMAINRGVSGGYSTGSTMRTLQDIGTVAATAIFGPVGGLIAGAASGVFNRAFGMKAREITGEGISGTFGASSGANVQNYSAWFQKGGWLRSNKSGTNYSAVSGELDQFLDGAIAMTTASTAEFAKLMGLSTDAVLGYTKAVTISLRGLDAAGRERALADSVSAFGEDLASLALGAAGRELQRQGETAAAALSRLSTSLAGVNDVLRSLGQTTLASSLQGGSAASALADLFGGLQNFGQTAGQYLQAYYTDAERTALASTRLSSAMRAFNVQLPTSRDGFRRLVEAQDLNTEAGRAAYAALLQLSGAFDELASATEQLAQQSAAALIERLSGRSGLVPAMGSLSQALAAAAPQAGEFVGQVHTIHRVLGDAASGTLTFGERLAAVSGELTPAQAAVAGLRGEVFTLREAASSTTVDMAGLSAALKGVDTATFVATITGAFERIGARVKSLLGSIADERVAVREAALGILDPTGLSAGQIRAQIAGSMVGMPSNAGVAQAQRNLSSADVLVARLQQQADTAARFSAAERAAAAAGQDLAALTEAANRARLQLDAASSTLASTPEGEWFNDIASAFIRNPNFDVAQEAQRRAQQALRAAEDALAAGRARQQAAAVAAGGGSVLGPAPADLAAALAQRGSAAEAAQAAQLDYTAALQKYSLDATRAVNTLGRLREETVKYYNTQKALADLMTGAAASLRGTVAAFRFDQLDAPAQLASLQERFSTAYSMALSTTGQTLAGYGQELNSLINPLLQKAQEAGLTGTAYSSLVATTLARAEATAKRLEDFAPKDYAAESLGLLGEIDSTLAALEQGAKSADQMIVDAIKAGADTTANGLRALIAAVTGQTVPAFATGGLHMGGVRLVGERGPELEVTGPARIYSAEQTARMMRGGDGGQNYSELVAELKGLRRDMQVLQGQIATNTGKLARQWDRYDVEGVPTRNADGETLMVKVEA